MERVDRLVKAGRAEWLGIAGVDARALDDGSGDRHAESVRQAGVAAHMIGVPVGVEYQRGLVWQQGEGRLKISAEATCQPGWAGALAAMRSCNWERAGVGSPASRAVLRQPSLLHPKRLLQWSTASAVAPTRASASAAFATRARPGSRSNGAIDVPATSHIAQIAIIIAVSTAILAAASVAVPSARGPLAKTAARATHASGLATPAEVPPASENAVTPGRLSE